MVPQPGYSTLAKQLDDAEEGGMPGGVDFLLKREGTETRTVLPAMVQPRRNLYHFGKLALLVAGVGATVLAAVLMTRSQSHGGAFGLVARKGVEAPATMVEPPVAKVAVEASVVKDEDVGSNEDADLGLAKDEGTEVAGEVELISDSMDCSIANTNCNETLCCKAPGARCFEKAFGWATCRKDCVPGPDPADEVHGSWSCKPLGKRTKGVFEEPRQVRPASWVWKVCSNDTANCMSSRCCQGPGLACYRKNDTWAGCKPDCTPGPNPTDTDNLPWECRQLGGRTPGWPEEPRTASWVKETCSNNHENCMASRCCRDPGHQCFEKDSSFAMCAPSCTKGTDLEDRWDWKPWSCNVLGARTPGAPPVIKAPQPASWVKDRCSGPGENCAGSKCCTGDSSQCYAHNSSYAECAYRCVKDANRTCDELGPRTLRAWGSPTLFCVHVFRLYSYEADIIRAQLSKGRDFRGGIFSCDQYALYASDTPAGTHVGDGPLGPVLTRHFESAPVWRSKDNTAGNTLLFQNFWEAVRWDYQYKCCEWTIKADPDAVLLPDRMRWKLKNYGGRPTYITTCNKGFREGPMMFGAVEAIATSALDRYFNSESVCRSLPWQSWGEDLWMGKCLLSLGIGPVEDHSIVGDNLCYGANCYNGANGAYHPFKSRWAWMNCYEAAML